MCPTEQQSAEKYLTDFCLTLPEVDAVPAWPPTRCLRVRRKMFAVFGDKSEPLNELTLTVKLPVSYEMVLGLPFVREGSSWYRQHKWLKAHFGPDDDITAELDLLKSWLVQSYIAMAPKSLGRLVQAEFGQAQTTCPNDHS